MLLPGMAAALSAAWRIGRRQRVASGAEFIAAVGYGFAVGAGVYVVQLIALHVWVNA